MKNKISGIVHNLLAIMASIIFNAFVGGFLAYAIGAPIMAGAVVWNVVGLITPVVNIYAYFTTGQRLLSVRGIAMEGLNKEIWVDRLLLDLFPTNDYMNDLEDMSEFVDNDKINFAGIGVAPNVEKNRDVYPIPLAPREDMPLFISLDEYSTDSTLIQDAETVELSYNKMDSVLKQHKQQLMLRLGNEGLFALAPLEDNANKTPIIETSGTANTAGNKKLVKADIAKLAEQFDLLEYPKEGRVIVMSPSLFWEFVGSDETLNRQYELSAQQGVVTGVLLNYYGFQIRTRTGVPHYEKVGSIWTRKAFGSEVEASDKYAAIAYVKGQSGVKAVGTTEMYGGDYKDPAYQGYVINFRMRGVVSANRQYMLGAIVQVSA